MNTDCDPMNWGWEMNNGSFSTIMTEAESGPQDFLEMILAKNVIAKNLVTNGVRVERLAFCDNAVDEQNIDDKNSIPRFSDAFN